MTTWRDGAGRITIKTSTGAARRFDYVQSSNGRFGICRAPGWLIVYGATQVNTQGGFVVSDEWLRAKARRKRLPRALRYNPDRDPRNYPEYDEW